MQPRRTSRLLLVLALGAARLPTTSVLAQEETASLPSNADDADRLRITGDRLGGFVLPIEPLIADIEIRAARADAWQVDDTKRLLLQGSVIVNVGSHHFEGERATVWLNRIPSEHGLINQLAVFFEEVSNPTNRAGIGAAGRNLLITASARGEVKLETVLLEPSQPNQTAFLREAQDRLADHLRTILAESPSLDRYPRVAEPPRREQTLPTPGGSIAPPPTPQLPEYVDLPPTEHEITLPLFQPEGRVRFTAERIEVESGEVENTIVCTGGLVIEYAGDVADTAWSRLTLTAERAVIFTDPGTFEELAEQQLSVEQVRGVYLEGGVRVMADEGDYIVRAPRIYYDFRTGRAIMLESVLRTYSPDTDSPIYIRADEMRQLAANQWQAREVRVSTSEYAVPHVALGAERILVTRRPSTGVEGEEETHFQSWNNTLRMSDVPIVWWPKFDGTIERTAMRSITFGTEENDGLRILTAWDLFALLGQPAPDGYDLQLNVDAFTARGAAIGLELRYDVGDAIGHLELYGLLDSGTDRTASGREVEPDQDFRGVALGEHQSKFGRYWTLQGQLALISDDTFISTWREEDFEERREYETSIYLKRQQDNTAATLLAKYELNDFVSNDWLLASRQYQVDRLPEWTYRRYGDSLFGDRVTYSGETRLSRLNFAFEENSPDELGIPGRAFGIGNDDEIGAALRTAGLNEETVSRLDSRHEFAFPQQLGAVKMVPFIVGRATIYDTDFDEFSSDSSDSRLFGAVGVRSSVQFQRVNNRVESALFDLHRMRHVIEPNVTAWYGHTNVNQTDLPIYDEEVESIADGAVVKLGLRNTWQTMRGGPGRWYSVNWLTLDTDLVIHSSEVDQEYPTAQFFDYRPENSVFGDHARAAFKWLLSDTFALTGEGIYDLENDLFARGSIGAELVHSPILSTYVEFRYIEASDNRLLGIGWDYQLTPKYRIRFRPEYDFEEEDFRSVRMRITRAFPDFDFSLQVRYDRILSDTIVGASVRLNEF